MTTNIPWLCYTSYLFFSIYSKLNTFYYDKWLWKENFNHNPYYYI